MQLAMSADVWVPLGAGVVALLIALFVLFTRGWRRVPEADAVEPGTDTPPPPPGTVAEAVSRRDPAPTEAPDSAGPSTDRDTEGEPPGSDRAVAAAVANALAARAGAARTTPGWSLPAPARHGVFPPVPRSAEPSAPEPRRSPMTTPEGVERPPSRADARDRLLAVLLDDPARAVGATVELDACRAQVERLTDALRHERAVLADVARRLADAGLSDEQLAKLARLPVDEVRELLAPASRSA